VDNTMANIDIKSYLRLSLADSSANSAP
jgi:hypothetical protein